jgi:hypothetical protein
MHSDVTRYVQERLPGCGRQILAARSCRDCGIGTLILRGRRLLCDTCDHTEKTPPAIAARLAGHPELPLFEEDDE